MFQVIQGGENAPSGVGLAHYVWLDSIGQVQFKSRSILITQDEKGVDVPLLLRWSFLTFSPTGEDKSVDVVLVPCFYCPNPIGTSGVPSFIAICETRDVYDECLSTNTRSFLRSALERRIGLAPLFWVGFELEYVLENMGPPAPHLTQRRVFVSDQHIGACLKAGLSLHSASNPGWSDEFEVKFGPRGFPKQLDPYPPTALVTSDHLIVALFLLDKLASEKGLVPRWTRLSIFVSTHEMRTTSAHHKSKVEAQIIQERIMTVLDCETRLVPDPIHQGVQCIEVSSGRFEDPYSFAMQLLEAVWPLGDEL